MKKNFIQDQNKPLSQTISKQYQNFLKVSQATKNSKNSSYQLSSKKSTQLNTNLVELNKSVNNVQKNSQENAFKSTQGRSHSPVEQRGVEQHKKSIEIKILTSRSVSQENKPERPALFSNSQKDLAQSICTENDMKVPQFCGGISIFQESTKQLEDLQQASKQNKDKPELQKGIMDILSLIKKEKQVIMNDMKQMTKQMMKYKQLYEEQLQEIVEMKRENKCNNQLRNDKDELNDTSVKMITLLSEMGVDYQQILPEFGSMQVFQKLSIQRIVPIIPQINQTLEKDEVIRIQKMIIKIQIQKIEQSRLLNSILLSKLKEQ